MSNTQAVVAGMLVVALIAVTAVIVYVGGNLVEEIRMAVNEHLKGMRRHRLFIRQLTAHETAARIGQMQNDLTRVRDAQTAIQAMVITSSDPVEDHIRKPERPRRGDRARELDRKVSQVV
jgi:hypothetical protein